MARIPIIMPKMSMTMTEGDVAMWLVKVGDQVNEGDVIAEVMTDKVDMEVESTHTGTLVEITVEEGTVAVGEPIGYLEGEESGLGDLFGSNDEGEAEEPRSEDPVAEPARRRRARRPAGHGARERARCDIGPDRRGAPSPRSGPRARPRPHPGPGKRRRRCGHRLGRRGRHRRDDEHAQACS